MNLHKLLGQIKEGKPVNIRRLAGCLRRHKVTVEELGETVFVSKDRYIVNVSDTTLLQKLIDQTAPSISRYDATLKGDSHSYRTSKAYFTAKPFQNEGSLLAIDCDKSLDSRYSRIVLIENSECFTHSHRFLNNIGVSDLGEDVLVMWSSGNYITHPAAISWLKQFDEVMYCPDFDLAGIQIYESLRFELGVTLSFIIPKGLIRYAGNCKKPKNIAHYMMAIEKSKALGLAEVVDLFETGLGVLEQEIFLGHHDE